MAGWQKSWWRTLLIVPLLVVLTWPSVSQASDGEPVQIGKNTSVPNDIATMTQDIVVDGTIVGDVTSWTGDITINGHVAGDVVSYLGDVTINAGAQVDGSVMAIGGRVLRHSEALVAGSSFGSAGSRGALSSMLGIVKPGSTQSLSSSESVGRILLGILCAFFLLAFSLLWAAAWPNRTLAAGMTLRRLPAQSLALGLLTTLLMLVLAPLLTALLAASLIGLPLLVVAIVAIHAPYVYGLATLARGFVLPTHAPDPSSPLPEQPVIIALVAIAVVIGVVAAFSPLVGLCAWYLIASPGLGAVLLSRAGMAVPRSLLRP